MGARSEPSLEAEFNSYLTRLRNTFSSLGKDHKHRRRRVTNAYTKTNLQNSPHVQTINYILLFERLLPQCLQSAASNQPLDILDLNSAYGLDFVSAFIFGMSRGTNFLQDIIARNDWFKKYLAAHTHRHFFWLVEAPNLRRWMARFGVHVVPKTMWHARKQLEHWLLPLVNETEEFLAESGHESPKHGEFPSMYSAMKTAVADERETIFSAESMARAIDGTLERASECLDHLGELQTITKENWLTRFCSGHERHLRCPSLLQVCQPS